MYLHPQTLYYIFLASYAVMVLRVSLEWFRHRDRQRRDIAAMFAVLFVSSAFPAVMAAFFDGPSLPLGVLWRALVITGYYLVIHVLSTLRAIPLGVYRLATGTWLGLNVVSVVAVLFSPGFRSALMEIIHLVGTIGVLYAGYTVGRSAANTGGVTSRRLTLMAYAALLVAGSTLVSLAVEMTHAIAAAIQLVMFGYLILAYLGFATPAWLRKLWQRNELYRFLRDCAGLPAEDRGPLMLQQLQPRAARAVGAIAAAAAVPGEEPGTYLIESDRPVLRGLAGQKGALSTPAPLQIAERLLMGKELAARAEVLQATALMVVPITTAQAHYGYLLLFLRQGSLFPEEDLALLSLMAEQVAIAMASTALIRAEHRLNLMLEERVRERTHELEAAKLEILAHLARAAEFRDDDTGEHQHRVGRTAALIAARMGLPPEEVALLRRAAPLHDVGKIGIPDAILLKPGRLTDAEMAVMRTHTTTGERILSGSRYSSLVAAREIALTHHERWDGTGYPAGLRGEQIPLGGRIVAVADVFDALLHARPYKQPWPLEQAISEIESGAGTQFDPDVVAVFTALVREGALPASGLEAAD